MTARTFLVLEALVEEDGRTAILRAYETACAPRAAPGTLKAPHATIRILDANDRLLARTQVELRFPQGCQTRCTQVGRAVVRGAVPAHPDARALELVHDDRVLSRAPVAAEPPELGKLSVKVAGNGRTVQARWSIDQKIDADVRLSLLVGGREFPVDAKLKPNGATFDLDAWAGLGEARLRVSASAGFRTTHLTSDTFALPPGSVGGRILSPLPGESWEAARPGSLMANLSDNAGRPIAWDPQRVRWMLDGKPLQDTRSIADPGELAGGKHRVALVLSDENGQTRELDRVEFNVRDETAAMKEWRAAVERHLARQSVAAGVHEVLRSVRADSRSG